MLAGTAAAAQHPLLETVIKTRWQITSHLGKGAFGEVFVCTDLVTQAQYAIKVEFPSAKKKLLKVEASIIHSPHFPKFYSCGRFNFANNPANDTPYTYMIIELLGPNLSDLRRARPHGCFSLQTTGMLATQMIKAIASLHHAGIIHRDIKPGNFCISKMGLRPVKCYLIDFGLSRRYQSSSGLMREARDKIGFRGTARYASIAAHQGKDLSLADDLWSLFYMLVEFLTGTLPWKGKEKESIGGIKLQHTNPKLVENLPIALQQFYSYLTSLTYSSRPDYIYLFELFENMIPADSSCPDMPIYYDWEDPSTHASAGIITESTGEGSLVILKNSGESHVPLSEKSSRPVSNKDPIEQDFHDDDECFPDNSPLRRKTKFSHRLPKLPASGILPTPPSSGSPNYVNLRSRRYYRN